MNVSIDDVERAIESKSMRLLFKAATTLVAGVLIPLLLFTVYQISDTIRTLTVQQQAMATQIEVMKAQMIADRNLVLADRDAVKSQISTLTDIVQRHSQAVQNADKVLQEANTSFAAFAAYANREMAPRVTKEPARRPRRKR